MVSINEKQKKVLWMMMAAFLMGMGLFAFGPSQKAEASTTASLPSANISDGVYVIVSQRSGKALDVWRGSSAMEANIIQWDRHDGANQQWKIVRTGDGYYNITSVKNPTLSFDVYRGSKASGTRVIQYQSLPWQANQKWKLIDNGDGTVTFIAQDAINSGTNYVLDVNGGSTANEANIIQYPYTAGNSNQRWYLIPQETVTMSFDSNGGSSVSSISYAFGHKLVSKPVNPVKAGYTFIGWFKDAGLTDDWDFANEKLSADMTLYAKWNYTGVTILGNATITASGMKNFINGGDGVSDSSTDPAYVPSGFPGTRADYINAVVDAFYYQGSRYGIRSDLALCQSIIETGWFKYIGSTVLISDNNFGGIYATGIIYNGAESIYSADPTKVSLSGNPITQKIRAIFVSIDAGAEAEFQHLYGYAVGITTRDTTIDVLGYRVIDPRYNQLYNIATTFEALGGKWAYPGFGSPYTTFEAAYAAGQTYGQNIVTIWNSVPR